MWEIAPDYLLASGLSNSMALLEQLVMTVDRGKSSIKGDRLLALCDRHSLESAKQDILRALSYKCLREREWSGALSYALNTNLTYIQSKIAKQILLEVNPDKLGQMRVFDALAEQFLSSPEMLLLFKFYSFKQFTHRGELNRAASLLHELIIDNCSPSKFHGVLFNEMIKLLSTTQRSLTLTEFSDYAPKFDRNAIMDMFRAVSMFQFRRKMDFDGRIPKRFLSQNKANAQLMQMKVEEQLETLRPMLSSALGSYI